jgi:hypothetical protein
MIETHLPGLFPSGFEPDERVNLSLLHKTGWVSPKPLPTFRIEDARPLQGRGDEATFFEQHGFVLLNAPTQVTDWSDGAQIAGSYLPEVEAIVRTRLYPGRKLIVMQPPFVVRRGAGTDNSYAAGVHQDHGTTADDYQRNVAAFAGQEIADRWRAQYDREDVTGFVVLDFWRTTNMAGPLRHMPLALCEPASVDPSDIFPTALEGIAPNGAITHHVGLRQRAGQRWYYYSAMLPDEVLVFRLFELGPQGATQTNRACFHCAVEDPETPADAEPRKSCEHRVSVLFLD